MPWYGDVQKARDNLTKKQEAFDALKKKFEPLYQRAQELGNEFRKELRRNENLSGYEPSDPKFHISEGLGKAVSVNMDTFLQEKLVTLSSATRKQDAASAYIREKGLKDIEKNYTKAGAEVKVAEYQLKQEEKYAKEVKNLLSSNPGSLVESQKIVLQAPYKMKVENEEKRIMAAYEAQSKMIDKKYDTSSSASSAPPEAYHGDKLVLQKGVSAAPEKFASNIEPNPDAPKVLDRAARKMGGVPLSPEGSSYPAPREKQVNFGKKVMATQGQSAPNTEHDPNTAKVLKDAASKMGGKPYSPEGSPSPLPPRPVNAHSQNTTSITTAPANAMLTGPKPEHKALNQVRNT